MANNNEDLGLIPLDETNTESIYIGTVLYSEHSNFQCLYGFRPPDTATDIFCYSPSVGFKSEYQDKEKYFIVLEFGALVWTYKLTFFSPTTYIANNLFALLPRGSDNNFGIFDKNRKLNKQATISAFGFTFAELEEIIQAYCKAFALYGYKEGRITFSNSRDNNCDLTGNVIPRQFPYITFAQSDYLWSHISFIGFYSHLSLLMQNGNESAFYQVMVDSGCSEELLERVIEIPCQVRSSRVCSSYF